MLLLTTAALPQLQQHRHPNLGRLIYPAALLPPRRHTRSRVRGGGRQRLFSRTEPGRLRDARSDRAVAERRRPDRHAWPWLSVPAELLADERGAEAHPNLLWIAVPDAVGDADATLEQFR